MRLVLPFTLAVVLSLTACPGPIVATTDATGSADVGTSESTTHEPTSGDASPTSASSDDGTTAGTSTCVDPDVTCDRQVDMYPDFCAAVAGLAAGSEVEEPYAGFAVQMCMDRDALCDVCFFLENTCKQVGTGCEGLQSLCACVGTGFGYDG